MTSNKHGSLPVALASIAAIAATTAVAGCSGETNPAAAPANLTTAPATHQRPTIDAAVVRGSSHYDYDVKTTPTALAADSAVVLIGSIAGWFPAESVIDRDERLEYAVVKVKVNHSLNGASYVRDGFAYLRLPRGGEVINEQEQAVRNPGARSTVTTVADLEAAAPIGTRLVVLGNPAGPLTFGDRAESVRNPGAGRPPGAPVVIPAPQGLLFETANGDVASGVADAAHWGWFPALLPADQRFERLTQAIRQ